MGNLTNLDEMKANLWGLSSKKIDSSLIQNVPSVKHERVKNSLGLSRCALDVLLSVYTVEGIGMRKLISFIPALRNQQETMLKLIRSGLLRDMRVIGKSSWQSSRKFYLTGKGKELVKRYYELMESK